MLIGVVVQLSGLRALKYVAASVIAAIYLSRWIAVQTSRWSWRDVTPAERELLLLVHPRGLVTVVLALQVVEATGTSFQFLPTLAFGVIVFTNLLVVLGSVRARKKARAARRPWPNPLRQRLPQHRPNRSIPLALRQVFAYAFVEVKGKKKWPASVSNCRRARSISSSCEPSPSNPSTVGHLRAPATDSSDALRIQQGSLYPALHRLERRAWIKARWGTSDNNRRAKYYELTKTGRKQLEIEKDAWERLTAAVAQVLGTAWGRKMISDLLFRLKSLFQRSHAEDELDDELRFHFERHVEKYVRSGVTPEEALRRARLEFGGIDRAKEMPRCTRRSLDRDDLAGPSLWFAYAA